MEYTKIKNEEFIKIIDVMRKADSIISYLHHRGYIQYQKENCPNKDDVMNLVGELRSIWERNYNEHIEVKTINGTKDLDTEAEIIHNKCNQRIEECKCEDTTIRVLSTNSSTLEGEQSEHLSLNKENKNNGKRIHKNI